VEESEEETREELLSDDNDTANEQPTVVSEESVDSDIGSDRQVEEEMEEEREEWNGFIFEEDDTKNGREQLEELTDIDGDEEVDKENFDKGEKVDVEEGRRHGEGAEDVDVEESGRAGDNVDVDVGGKQEKRKGGCTVETDEERFYRELMDDSD
jgi:hypothetical protein